ncbi:MAG: hypothetical protein JWO95_2831 [Verrucomicrobiales bacterium]|nr:hypothetical protein [Verrucomicrobiales bacterium]
MRLRNRLLVNVTGQLQGFGRDSIKPYTYVNKSLTHLVNKNDPRCYYETFVFRLSFGGDHTK